MSNTCEAGAGSEVVRQLSVRPRIFHFPSFLSHDECDALRALAEPNLKPSRLSKNRVEAMARSSNAYKLSEAEKEAPLWRRLRERFAQETKMPLAHLEQLEVQRYAPDGQEFYVPHYDSLAESIGPRQRIATFILYLDDAQPATTNCTTGGETIFPLVDAEGAGRLAPGLLQPPHRALKIGGERFLADCEAVHT